MANSVRSDYSNWFFILGTGRCGSSVFHELLARHEQVGFISNLDDRSRRFGPVGRWNNALYRGVPPQLTRKGRPRFAPSEGYRMLSAEVSPVMARPERDLTAGDLTPWLSTRLRAAFESRAQRQDTATFSHKFTGWPRSGLLGAAFPGCKFVNVVRDGRAVANSLLQMPWWGGYGGTGAWRYGPLPDAYQQLWEESGRSFPVLAGLTWRLLMDAYEQAQSVAAPGDWLTVRYEDVVASPREHFERILDHVGLTWSARFEQGLARHPLRPERTDSFLRDLAPSDVTAIEGAISPMLDLYQYSRSDA